MPFLYRCDTCKTTSPPVPDRAALDRERQCHRDKVHGGHVPDQERTIRTGRDEPRWLLWRVVGVLLVVWLVWLAISR